MIDVRIKIHQPAGFDVQIWNLPVDKSGRYLGGKPYLVDVIFCCTKQQANKIKNNILCSTHIKSA